MHRTVTPCVEISDTDHFTLLQPKEKWLKKRTKIKIKVSTISCSNSSESFVLSNGKVEDETIFKV